MKRMVRLLLVLALAVTLCPMVGAAESDFVIDENGVLTKYSGSGGDVVIPDGVTGIGHSAFEGCTGLTSVTIPSSVTAIGDCAFYNCSLASVTIPNSVIGIGAHAFSCCHNLTSVIIPDGVTAIGFEAFSHCITLTSVTIPGSVTSMDIGGVFSSCPRLTSAGPIGGKYHIEFGWTEEIPDYAFSGSDPYSSLTSITIPDGVTSIGNSAFSGCHSLTSITIPDSVTSIGNAVFYDCFSLTDITIPESVTSIGTYAFKDCYDLTSVTIPDGVTSIGSETFLNCTDLTSVTIPNSVTSIGDRAFLGCTSLTSVTIPDGVTSIGIYAFFNCSGVTSVTIPDGVTSIGRYAFHCCHRLTDVYYGGTEADWAKVVISDENAPLTSATIHYATVLAVPTLGSGDKTASFSYTEFGKLTLTDGEIAPQETVFVACYNENGRFTGVKAITAEQRSANIGTPDSFKLIWLGGNYAPQCGAVTVMN